MIRNQNGLTGTKSKWVISFCFAHITHYLVGCIHWWNLSFPRVKKPGYPLSSTIGCCYFVGSQMRAIKSLALACARFTLPPCGRPQIHLFPTPTVDRPPHPRQWPRLCLPPPPPCCRLPPPLRTIGRQHPTHGHRIHRNIHFCTRDSRSMWGQF